MDFKFDASLLQFTPKGSYYNTQDEQNVKITGLWKEFLNYDRFIFSLSLILPTSAYAEGRMSHLLLKEKTTAIVPREFGISIDYEEKIILHCLRNQSMAKALKNLLMVADKKFGRVKNAKVKRIVLKYIFERDINSLENMVITFKVKIGKLLKHAFGREKVLKILNQNKKYGLDKYHERAIDIVKFVFNKPYNVKELHKLNAYVALREYAKLNSCDSFLDLAKKSNMNFEIILGFKNFYKLDIDLEIIYEVGKMSDKQKIQSVRARERVSVERCVQDIDYKKYDIYDIYKMFYIKLANNETNDMDEIVEAIKFQSTKKLDIDLGEIVVIMDASKSMVGSDTRPYHPFLTGLSLVSKLPNVKDVRFVGGEQMSTGADKMPTAIVPSGATKIWDVLIQAVNRNTDTIILISDGYENNVKGLTNFVYEKLKDQGKMVNLIHVNPVFAAETGNARRIVSEIKPFMIENYKMIKTNLLFELIMTNKELAKKMLIKEYLKIEKKEFNRLKG